MAGFNDIHASLQTSSLNQLGFAFAAAIAYGVAQGQLFGPTGRQRAWLVALLGAAGFCIASDVWVHGAVLVAFGLVVIGLFAALVVGLSRLLGVAQSFVGAPSASLACDAVGIDSAAAVESTPSMLLPAVPEPAHST